MQKTKLMLIRRKEPFLVQLAEMVVVPRTRNVSRSLLNPTNIVPLSKTS